MCVTFYKYHSSGNDYLVYDCLKNSETLNSGNIPIICSTNFGLGFDGIMMGPIIEEDGMHVRIFNLDGSEAKSSANGICIFSKYLKDAGYVTNDVPIVLQTLGGPVQVRYNDNEGTNITVFMGRLSFSREDIGCVGTPEQVVDVPIQFGEEVYQTTCVSIGNSHCVIPMSNVFKKRVCEIGQHLQETKYFPDQINTQIVKVLDRNNIKIEIFNRKTGYTLASGSSSCAAAGAVYRLGLVDEEVCVHMQGGKQQVHIAPDWNVELTGEVYSEGKMIFTDEFVKRNQIGS